MGSFFELSNISPAPLHRKPGKARPSVTKRGAESQSLIVGTARGEQELAPPADEWSLSASLRMCKRLMLCRWLSTSHNGSMYKAVINRHCNSGFVVIIVGEAVYQSCACGHSPLYREQACYPRQNPMFETS